MLEFDVRRHVLRLTNASAVTVCSNQWTVKWAGYCWFCFREEEKKRFPETCATTRDQGVCSGLSGDLRKARSNRKPVEIPYIPENSSISFPMCHKWLEQFTAMFVSESLK